MIRSLLYAFCAVVCALGAGVGAMAHDGFTSGMCVEKFGTPAGNSLKVDSMASDALWNVVYRTPAGLFKPGKSYRINFSYAIHRKSHPEAGLVFLVRPADVQHGNSDLYIAIGDQTKPTAMTIDIDIPAGADQYAFDLHSKYGVLADVDDFSVSEVQPRFTTFSASREPVATELNDSLFPTGSAAFTVQKPAPAPDAPVLYGRDFGFSTTASDNSEAFRRAIEACRKAHAAALVLDSGTYRFANTMPLLIDGLEDFTLDGSGATLLFSTLTGTVNAPALRQGGQSHLTLTNCRRVLFKNMNIDWDWEVAPLASFVQVVARGRNANRVDVGNNWLEFEFVDYERFPADRVRIADIEAVDPETRSVGRSDQHHSALFQFIENHPDWGNPGKLEWTAPNRVKVYQSRDAADQNWFFQVAQVGMLYRMRHFAYDTTSILFNGGNSHVTMRDMNLFSCPGMGVLLLNGQEYLEFDNFNTTLPAGSRRPISCTSDNFHSSMSQGHIRFQNCDFGWGGDDLMNFTDSNGCAKIVAANTLEVRNYGVQYLTPGEKIELRKANFAPLGREYTIRSVDQARNLVETVEPLPTEFGPDETLVLFYLKYDTRNVVIRNSRFHDNRGHGIVASVRDLTIENNEFDHTAFGGIMLSTGYVMNYWGEGMGVSNAVIRGNRFRKVNPVAADSADKFAMDIAIFLYAQPESTEPLYPLMNGILLEKNTFIDPSGAVLYADNVSNVFFVDNTIEVRTPRSTEFAHRGAVVLENVADSTVANNTWLESPLNHPTIMVSTPNSPQVTVSGNQVK